MPAVGAQRVDKWLFFARAVKSRSLGAKLVELGRVRINGQRAERPSDMVKSGDTLTLTMDRTILVWRVLGPGERRGPAPEARLLYDDLSQAPAGDAPPSEIAPLRQVRQGER